MEGIQRIHAASGSFHYVLQLPSDLMTLRFFRILVAVFYHTPFTMFIFASQRCSPHRDRQTHAINIGTTYTQTTKLVWAEW